MTVIAKHLFNLNFPTPFPQPYLNKKSFKLGITNYEERKHKIVNQTQFSFLWKSGWVWQAKDSKGSFNHFLKFQMHLLILLLFKGSHASHPACYILRSKHMQIDVQLLDSSLNKKISYHSKLLQDEMHSGVLFTFQSRKLSWHQKTDFIATLPHQVKFSLYEANFGNIIVKGAKMLRIAGVNIQFS